MMMKSIRRLAKKYRVLAVIIVALIALSIVFAFALGGTGGVSHNPDTQEQLLAQHKAYEDIIAAEEAKTEAEKDYAYYYTLGGYYADFGYVNSNLQNGQAVDAYMKATTAYETALSMKPENLDDVGLALLYVNIANNAFYSNDQEKAEVNFNIANMLDPESLDVAGPYSFFLFNRKMNEEGLNEAKDYLNDYIELVKDDAEKVETAEAYIAYFESTYQQIQDLFESLTIDGTDVEPDGDASNPDGSENSNPDDSSDAGDNPGDGTQPDDNQPDQTDDDNQPQE